MRWDTMPRPVLFSTLPKATIFPNATAASLPCNFCARWRARARRTPKPVLLVAATVLVAVAWLFSVAPPWAILKAPAAREVPTSGRSNR